MGNIYIANVVLDITTSVARCLLQHFPDLDIYVANDIPGEDHVYAQYQGSPVFDLLVTTARKFVFLWYYAMPHGVAGDRGVQMVDQLRVIALDSSFDLVVKYAEARVTDGAPALIIRQNKQSKGQSILAHPKFQKFIVKKGNPQLEMEKRGALYISTYRNYEWQFPRALACIKNRSQQMMLESLKRTSKVRMQKLIASYVLYAGCAFHYVYPQLGFGMRDIDVNVFFRSTAKSKGMRSARGALSRHCGIEQFGMPEYFGHKTRLIDVMWNVLKEDDGCVADNILAFVHTMRFTSDRWATISQRPFVDLGTRKVMYVPAWLRQLDKDVKTKNLFSKRGGIYGGKNVK